MKKSLNWLFDYPNLKLYQYEEGFKFSLDSILLSEFAVIKKNDEVIVDMCTGNGVIPTILAYKYQDKKITGIELQEEIYDLAKESLSVNNLENRITYINDDVKNILDYYANESVDIVLCNPPYFKYFSEEHTNNVDIKKFARHEVTICLEDVIRLASVVLKNKGKLYLVHIPERLDEVIILGNKYNMAVKELQLIYTKENENAKIMLVSLVKNGRNGIKIRAPKNISGLSTYQNLFDEKR